MVVSLVAMAQDWIREFSVLTLQFPAEYGAAGGGVVNAVTRSGDPTSGMASKDFYQNSALNSNPEVPHQATVGTIHQRTR